MLFEHHQKLDVSLEDVEEVSHYVKAIYYGLQRLKEGFSLSLRLLKEIHAVLLSGGSGSLQLPGEIRRSQNWIGGTRPGNEPLPGLIKAGIAHVYILFWMAMVGLEEYSSLFYYVRMVCWMRLFYI